MPDVFKKELCELFEEFQDVFAMDHTELKGIDPRVCQHRIPLKADAMPIRLQRYRMNPNYAKKVKEELDALLKAGFITEVVIPQYCRTKKEWQVKGLCRFQEAK